MMIGYRRLWLCCVGLVLFSASFAQEVAHDCGGIKRFHNTHQLRTTVADTAEEKYDVQYLRFNISMNNTSTDVSGSVHTEAKVVAPSMSSYFFELASSFTVDSVKINNQLVQVFSNGDLREAVLLTPLNNGVNFSTDVFYHGTGPSGGGVAGSGITNGNGIIFPNLITYTLSEPYQASSWWPCKQSLQDKVDSADLYITVPDSLRAGSNGILLTILPKPGNKLEFHWQTRYPTAYYLFSASVTRYQSYQYYIRFPNSNDSMLYQNFIYDFPTALPFYKNNLDTGAMMMLRFSELYGRFPFWKEKYGHCLAPVSGGMEHQTMTTQGNFNFNLTCHEMGHQWFGDYVTCATWKDIWLNEGFASYSEYLTHEYFRGPVDAAAYLQTIQNVTLKANNKSGTIYGEDTTVVGRIFDGRLSYNKPAAVIHTLRYVAGKDSLFFSVLKTYLQTYAFKNATTAQFQAIAEQVLQKDLDTFFHQWIYSSGYPLIDAAWNQVNENITVRLTQSNADINGIKTFRTPLEIKLHSAAKDTTIVIEMKDLIRDYRIAWNQPITNIIIDPNNWVLNGGGNTKRDRNITTDGIEDKPLVYPNPANTSWHVIALPTSSDLVLYDLAGQKIWSQTSSDDWAEIPAMQLATGIYILHVVAKDGTKKVVKLVRM